MNKLPFTYIVCGQPYFGHIKPQHLELLNSLPEPNISYQMHAQINSIEGEVIPASPKVKAGIEIAKEIKLLIEKKETL